jgi:hypothetical protein
MNPLIQVKKTIPLFLLVFACLALSPQAPAVCQQGCDPTNDNTFLGDDALLNNTTGDRNTAIGFQALLTNTIGNFNTATGVTALLSNTIGDANTATGDRALFSNTNGSFNTATGSNALGSNTTGFRNMANGVNALYFNTTGYRNTANGYQALYFNTTGSRNTAEGFQALFHNIGSDNVGLGFNAGSNRTTGSGNVLYWQRSLGGCWREQHHSDQKYLPLGRIWPSSLRQFRQQNGHARLLAPVQGPDPAHG